MTSLLHDPAPPSGRAVPAPAPGTELLGLLDGSGYRSAPGLVRRADGQTLQVTPLTYALLGLVDGVRDEEELARALSDAVDREVDPDDVRYLLAERLAPLGLLTGADGTVAPTQRTNPLLGLRLKVVVSDPRWTERLTTPFAQLFRPWVVVPALAAFAWVLWWLAFDHGLGQATRSAVYDPGMLLAVVGLTVLSAGFHEFGHAAACRYGGARPGVMGFGLYLVWPAFYTDVDDSYRLSRWGRLRVDLGGLYFNVLVALATVVVWWATGVEALLLLVATQVLQMSRQLAPFIRADGYHLLADLTGVPDLFAHLGPTLRGLLPPYRGRPRGALKPWARVVVSLWVLTVVPLLVGLLALAVWVLPRLALTAWDGLGLHAARVADGARDADPVAALAALLALVALVLPVLGVGYLLLSLLGTAARRTWARTSGRPRARLLSALGALLLAGLVLWSWSLQEQRGPIGPQERGTLPVADLGLAELPVPDLAVPGLTALAPAPEPAAPAPLRAAPAALRAAPAVLGPVAPAAPLTVAEPAPPVLAAPARVALASPDEVAAPVLPAVGPLPQVADGTLRFALPLPPAADGTQAVALGLADRRLVYDAAYALVEVTDGRDAVVRNEAWALASCGDCVTVAVSVQVVLVVGDSRVVVPVNTAVAANERCVRCVTQALAVQVVATLDALPDAAVRAQLDGAVAGLREVSALVARLELRAAAERVHAVEADVLSVLTRSGLLRLPAQAASAQDGAEPAVTSPLSSAGPSAPASAAPSASPGPVPTPPPGPSPSPSPVAVLPAARPATEVGPTCPTAEPTTVRAEPTAPQRPRLTAPLPAAPKPAAEPSAAGVPEAAATAAPSPVATTTAPEPGPQPVARLTAGPTVSPVPRTRLGAPTTGSTPEPTPAS